MSAEKTDAKQATETVAGEPESKAEPDVKTEAEAIESAIVDAAAEAGKDATMEKATVTKTEGPSGETEMKVEVITSEPVDVGTSQAPSAAKGPADLVGEDVPTIADSTDLLKLPPHGTEVFVGGIPRSATEADIRTFAAKIGEVHSVKMSYDPNNPGQHRGFGFVRYHTREIADEAKEKLNETKLQGTESLLRLSSSQSKYRLYIGNLPKAWTKDQLTDEINKTSKGLETVELVPSRDVPGQNRGYAFLTFYNHECAAAAKDAFSKPSFKPEGRTLTISFAEPKEPEQPPLKSRAVYVGGLPNGASDEKIKELFVKHGEVLKVVIPPATEKRPEQRFCFVHFAEQSSADKAVADAEAGEKPVLDEKTLEVKAARPQENRLESRQQFDSYGAFGRGGRGGRAPGPYMRGGRMGRGGRGPPMGRGPPPANYYPPAYDQGYGGYGGYDQGYGAYDQAYAGGYDQGYAGYDQGYAGYDQYGGYEAQPQSQAGMTMVPMMLQNGQVGYVLQNEGQQGGEYAAQGTSERNYGPARGRGQGQQRYRPY